MLNVKELKKAMAVNGYDRPRLAEALGMSTRTLATRFKTGDFGASEIQIMIKILKLKKPMDIFFAD